MMPSKEQKVRDRAALGSGLAVVLLALMVALAFGVSMAAAQGTVEAPSFNGVWERNPDESDDPREKLQEAVGGQKGGKDGQGGGFGGRGGRPPSGMGGMGGRGGSGRSGEMQAMRETMRDAMEAAQTLELTLSDGELRVIDGSERVRIYYLDGEKHKRETAGGVALETVSERKGDQIVIEEKADKGAKITRTFALAPDGSVMVVTVRLENKRLKEPVVIRSVYDPLRDSETS
jgi:hypothetical protein